MANCSNLDGNPAHYCADCVRKIKAQLAEAKALRGSANIDALIRQRNRLDIENERLREALDRICRPIWWMQEDQKRKTGSINGIRGSLAIARSESSEYLRGIARDALSTNEVPKAKNANNLQPEKE